MLQQENIIKVSPGNEKVQKEKSLDPFYSEANIKAILEAKAQLDKGEGIKFDINASYR